MQAHVLMRTRDYLLSSAATPAYIAHWRARRFLDKFIANQVVNKITGEQKAVYVDDKTPPPPKPVNI